MERHRELKQQLFEKNLVLIEVEATLSCPLLVIAFVAVFAEKQKN
jgi:predicted small integral membrane protein